MSLEETLASLVKRLVGAVCFEEASTAVLQSMLSCADQALETYRIRGKLLRGVVHLRPEGAYERLFGIEHATGQQVEGTGYLTSGNVWTWIQEHRCSVSIDVQRASIRSWLPDGPIERHEALAEAGLPGDVTRERLLGRDATHVHVVPLCAPGNMVHGMITLEANSKAAVGDAFIWRDCHTELQTLANVAGAFMAARSLPIRPTQVCADEFLPVVGPTTMQLMELLRAFAKRDDTILITGPTGAGKSRLARWCHEHSSHKGHPFEHLDLLGVPEELQPAELFGWKRGAYTGAVRDNRGAIARAAKGTLFLDEIDKLSLKAQAGLLRFIEGRSYRMLGDDSLTDRQSEVRLLIGTNADLRAAVRAGRFREDLYYRINVLPVRLLPLAERLDELPLWADYMLNRRHREAGGLGTGDFEPEAMALLRAAPWPGNLRQLDNIIRRAYALLLAGQNEMPSDPVIQRHHVERAITFDNDDSQPAPLAALLWRAARAFVNEAERRQADATPLTLESADAFRGMVLAAAVQQTGNRDEVFTLLGQQPLVRNRNHHRALRRELSRVREFLLALRGPIEPDVLALLESILDGSDADADASR